MNTTKPSGVLFDFDGVVVDSLAVHILAWKESYLALYGLELADTEGLPGRSTMAIAEILSNRAGRPETKVKLAEHKKEVLRSNQHKVNFLPGARECFDFLRDRRVPFGIASNAPRSFIESTLRNLNYSVEYLFGSDDVAQPKPEPDVFLKCAKAIGVSVINHPNTIVFEDSPHGIRAAVRAGMFPIGILTQNTNEDMVKAGAFISCNNLKAALSNGWLEYLPKLVN